MTAAFIRPNAPMCLVMLTYVAELDSVDAHMAAHVAWLAQGFDAGVLVVAGRRKPRTGGVLLFRGERDEVEALAHTDPFVTEGVATIEVVPFTASMATTALGGMLA